MRQLKRLFYFVLLNIIISGVTVVVVLQLWERNHPSSGTQATPAVIVVTSTGADNLPKATNLTPQTDVPTDSGLPEAGTVEATPTIKMLVYQVKEGDSLGALAIQFNLSIDDLLLANDLADPDSLYAGQLLYIPTAPLPKVTPTSVPTTAVPSATLRPSSTPTYGPTVTTMPTQTWQAPQVVIETVIGSGELDFERVVLQRTGDGDLSLSGWRLEDGTGKEYIFPSLTLYKGGGINLYTRTGQDTVTDLFWGLNTPIWRSGKAVSLYDAQKNLRATYTVP